MTASIARLLAATTLFAAATPPDGSAQIFRDTGPSSDSTLITVTGTGTVYMQPTRAVVFVEIVSEEAAPDLATLANGQARAAVIQALETLGYSEQEVGLWGYGTAPAARQGYGPPAPGDDAAYQAKSGVRVIVEPLDRLDAVSTNLLAAGASVTTVILEADDIEEAQAEAMRQAVESARTQAETMAAAAGGRLDRLYGLTNTPDYNAIGRRDMRWNMYPGGPGSQGVILMPPDVMITASVTGSWIFRPN